MISKIKENIEKNKEDMINNICELIKIPSVSDEDGAKENMPFGENCNKALDYILTLGKSMGFRTKNVDGYCGYLEFGEGEELVGIIGHLDVVPADESDWKITKPFEPKVIENKIYGRGAIDDKGPTIAALYAMKAVEENVKINKRVRLIVGLNEEKSWKCINHYKENEEIPTVGFSPDADFPCIYAEKSILNTFIEIPYENNNEKIIIKNIDSKNNALNVVPKYCECDIELKEIDINEIKKNIEKLAKENKINVSTNLINNNTLKIISNGISSHAAHPDLGKNAITQILIILTALYKKYSVKNELLEFFERYLGIDYNGNKLQINKKDESGELTLNIGDMYVNSKTSTLKISMNLRIPVDTKIDTIKEKLLEKEKEFKKLKITFGGEIEHLYIDKNSELVTMLTKIFNEETNKNEKPITIGGATFARAFPNCVSFGANMPGDKDLCHQADENISVNNLIISAKIYAGAIYELQNMKSL